MSHMKEKVVLITGASSGIGRATAEAFAAKGANIVVAARRQKELDTLVASIEALGGKASAIKTDVSIAKSVEQMVAHTIEVFGRLDYAINNADKDDVVLLAGKGHETSQIVGDSYIRFDDRLIARDCLGALA